ncbi:hypothetical protein [Thiomicrorhabdus indica]|uniref:hypothetical protein n=1 Tax=Thiomicrorhabdus indica TaxID=2267253 RepID=UPI002AA772EA|nr:hypothetical protein [Thiomicrorhabdus indica]
MRSARLISRRLNDLENHNVALQPKVATIHPVFNNTIRFNDERQLLEAELSTNDHELEATRNKLLSQARSTVLRDAINHKFDVMLGKEQSINANIIRPFEKEPECD